MVNVAPGRLLKTDPTPMEMSPPAQVALPALVRAPSNATPPLMVIPPLAVRLPLTVPPDQANGPLTTKLSVPVRAAPAPPLRLRLGSDRVTGPPDAGLPSGFRGVKSAVPSSTSRAPTPPTAPVNRTVPLLTVVPFAAL